MNKINAARINDSFYNFERDNRDPDLKFRILNNKTGNLNDVRKVEVLTPGKHTFGQDGRHRTIRVTLTSTKTLLFAPEDEITVAIVYR